MEIRGQAHGPAWLYKTNGRNHVRAVFLVSYKHVHVRELPHFFVHTPSLDVGRPLRRVGIPSGRVVTPSPFVSYRVSVRL